MSLWKTTFYFFYFYFLFFLILLKFVWNHPWLDDKVVKAAAPIWMP